MSASPMPLLPLTTPETLNSCKNLAPDDGLPVCFISSYPKSGTTWLQAIVYHVLRFSKPASDKQQQQKGAEEEEQNEREDRPFTHISDFCPFYEIQPQWDNYEQKNHQNHKFLGWRVYNTHLIPSLLPSPASSSTTFKYIYVMRNGIDVMKSFYHHLSNQVGDGGGYSGGMCKFLEEWSAGDLPYGQWVKHIHNWTTDLPSSFSSSSSSILFLRYEEMKKDLRGTIEAIAAFLDRAPLSPETISSVLLPSLSFEGMRKQEEKYHPVSVKWKTGFHFIRKGETSEEGKGEEEEKGEESDARCRFPSLIYPQLPSKKEVQERGSQWRNGGGEKEREPVGEEKGERCYQSDVEWLDDLTRCYSSLSS